MQECDYCGEKFVGRANQKYCSKAHRNAAWISRQRTQKETRFNALTSAQIKDMNYIKNQSADAYKRLRRIRATYGTAVFDDALDAVFSAVIDTIENR